MKVTFSIAKSSGERVVLGKSNGRWVRFSAAAFELGYAAMQAKRIVIAAANYLAAESAAVSVNCECGITVERSA